MKSSSPSSPGVILRRLVAFLIDYCIILAYIAVLVGVSLALFGLSGREPSALHPLPGQFVGFFTLTIPVFLYFYLSEKGKHRTTLGKRKMGIQVNSEASGSVFWHNVLKFLPWEFAHTGVHWMAYYAYYNLAPPAWVMITLVVPQIVVIGYLVSILYTKGRSALYDQLAGTEVGQFTQS